MQVIGWTVGAIIIGALLYPLLMMARERKWCRFVGISPHEYKEALRGGIPQSASMTSFAAVYGAASDDECSGLLPPQSMGGQGEAGPSSQNGVALGQSSTAARARES